MNKIFIYNNTYYEEFYLNFKFDILSNLTDNKYFKFEILNINELKIYWYENEEILYTEDSYLYFLDKTKMKTVKKVYIYHTEWKDQCIMNFENNIISRINIRNENGKFEYFNDKFIINWNNWGIEIFEYFDEYTFYKLDYLKNIESLKMNNIYNNYIFIHICCLENWKEIFEDIVLNIKNSGLYNNVKKIFLGIFSVYYFHMPQSFDQNRLDHLVLAKFHIDRHIIFLQVLEKYYHMMFFSTENICEMNMLLNLS
jgi:hypothetical protein